MAEPWRGLLQQLSMELERQSAKLQDLELQNKRLLEATALPVEMSEMPPIVQCDLPSPPGPEGPGDVRRSRRSQEDEDEDEVTGLKTDIILPHPHRPSKISEISQIALAQPRRNSRVSKLIESQQVRFMIMRAQRTREFGVKKRWFVINPDTNRFSTAWQIITNFALAFVALITPLQVGLLEIHLDFLFVLTMMVDFVFVIDMILQFVTMYPRTTARGLEWELNPQKIAMNYLRTWFFLDFVTLIPFDMIGVSSGTDSLKDLRSIKVIRVLRLLKLMRLLRSSRLTHRLEIPLSIPYQQVALFRFLLILVLACHWLACVWAMTLKIVDDTFPQWINDIEAADVPYGIRTRDSPMRIYIAAYYFCCYTMTSVGYGDNGPKNVLERLVCTWIVLTSGLSWAYILGEVCAIVSEMTAEGQRFRKKMHHLNSLMQEQGLPPELRKRMRSFFLQNRHQAEHQTRQKLLENLSPQLHAEVCTALNMPWIEKVSFFQQFMSLIDALEADGAHTAPFRACIADISRELQTAAFAQKEIFDNVQVLYILSKGLVALNSRVGHNGAVWGEDFVLSDTSLIRPVAGFALTYIEVLFLTRESFMGVIERRKLTCPQLGQVVRRYCVRVAVTRGIIAEARRRLQLRAGTPSSVAKRVQGSQQTQGSSDSAPQPPGFLEPED